MGRPGQWHEPSHRFDYALDRDTNRTRSRVAENWLRRRYGQPEKGPYTDKQDGGIDITFARGRWKPLTVDVKWSMNHDSPLRLNLTVKAVSLVFVLITGWPETDFVLRGYAWRARLLAAPETDPGARGTPCHELAQKELHPNVDGLVWAAIGEEESDARRRQAGVRPGRRKALSSTAGREASPVGPIRDDADVRPPQVGQGQGRVRPVWARATEPDGEVTT